MKMRLRVILYSALAFSLLQIVGYFPVFKLQQKFLQHKIEVFIKRHIQKKDIHIISISSDNQHELHWQRKDKEFWYRGQLYDIVHTELQGDVVLYHCFNDTAETHLTYKYLESLQKQTEQPTEPHKSHKGLVKKVFKVYYLSPQNNESLIVSTPLDVKKQEPIPYLKHYQSVPYQPNDPPPKSLV
ncbi:MAG: hypothetical protein JNL70_23870 [Saprospiraceae bacterium]|nr:hypothetical protein [Saprospiraceae bacterium]